jgi:hypothetical protein
MIEMEIYITPGQLVSKSNNVYTVTDLVGQGAFGHVYRVYKQVGNRKEVYVCKLEQRD